MKQKLLILGIGLTLGIGSMNSANFHVSANSGLENQKEDIEDKRSDVKSDIKEKQGKLNEIKSEQASLDSEIKRLDQASAETSQGIREKEGQITETKTQIEALEKEIEEVKQRIAKRDELLKDRMRTLQASGGMVSYIDVILGAKSFSDFIDRVNAISQFVQADKDIIKAHQDDQKLKEDKEVEVTEQLAQLEVSLGELEKLQKDLESQIEQKNTVMAQLKSEEAEMHNHLLELEEQEKLLAAQERAIQKAIEEWNRKQRELEEARKKNPNGTPPPAVTSGNWMNPTTGTFTSGFGSRSMGMHYGVDIANKSASVPVVAAADGIVFRSYLSSSYGNCIFVTHNVDGQIYTTVYAHLETRNVSEGQVVSKGQLIGYMGYTGHVVPAGPAGKHLHFELHKGPWNARKSNAVNPASYINF